MALPPEIPESIRQEIAIYLGADERILKVLSSMSERIEAVGEVWLILTNLSVFFFTRRHGREPVVALLARKDIREIEYFEKRNGIVLTFVPERNPSSSTRLSFPLSRKEALEDFCEDLADLIRFKKETPAGVKSYKQDSESTTPAVDKLSSDSGAKAATAPKTAAATKPAVDEKVRIVQSASVSSASSTISPTSSEQGAKSSDSSKAPPAANKGAGPRPVPASSNDEFDSTSACLYVMMATLISILVGFIWYKFFRALIPKH